MLERVVARCVSGLDGARSGRSKEEAFPFLFPAKLSICAYFAPVSCALADGVCCLSENVPSACGRWVERAVLMRCD